MTRRSPLYDAVWVGMAVYARSRFELELTAPRPVELRPGTIFVATHRRDADIPVICGSLALAGRIWRDRRVPAGFTPRDDMFLPGFLAGVTPRLPVPLRRALFDVSIGGTLRRRLDCLPIGRPDRMPLAQLLRADPAAPLAEAAPAALAERIRRRAAGLGLRAPATGADVLRGEYADLLWERVRPDEVPSERFEALWRARRREALGEFRRVVEYVREGGSLLFFPEGTPSKDGSVGPVEPGLAAIVRHGRPRALRAVGIAYDPLVEGRPRAVVHLAPEVEPPGRDVDRSLLSLLRRALPLTRGQLAARHLLAAGADASPVDLEREAAAAVELARDEGRPVEAALLDAPARPELLAASLARAREAAPELVRRLARELESARADRARTA